MSIHHYKEQGPQQVRCAVITVSDTRTEETDKSGSLIKSLLDEQGHQTIYYALVKDEKTEIEPELILCLNNKNVDCIILNGGTGLARRDVTYESVERILEKEIPGFGELFRMLSYTEDIGSAAMLSRAIAGAAKNKVVFSLPGSTGAVKLAMTKLILPELRHLIFELTKDL